MPRRAKVEALPLEVKHWLERALTESNFSGYEQLAAMLAEQGYALSKSAIHRYGQKIERRFSAIKASTEAARLLCEGAADDQDARSEAVIALVQTEMFEQIINLQEASDEETDPAERVQMLSKVARNLASLTGASVRLKQYQAVLREKTKAAAEAVTQVAHKGGLSADAVDIIRREILGIAR